MPSTYSPDLRIELIANGEKSGTWGTITNDNLGVIIEDAISGLATVSVLSANQALTALNGAADQARCAAISLTTSTTANFAVYVPPVTKLYVIQNTTSYVATIYASTVIGNTTPAGTGAAIPAGKTVLLRCDGTNVFDQFDHVVSNLSVGGALAVTGNTTITGNASTTGTSTLGNALILGGSPGTSGQVVVSQGAGTNPVWGPGFVPGMIMMWSGTIATIPSGWLLCNGSSGTPDLRDRFIVGASVDSGGQSVTTITGGNTKTGGSKDAIVVSHTHTATSVVTDPGHFHSLDQGTGLNPGAFFQPSPTLLSANAMSTKVQTTGITVATTNNTSGSSGTDANLVPYFALAFIMKA